MKIKDIINRIENASFDEVLEYVIKKAQKNENKTFIVTVNPEIVMLARDDNSYEKVLNSADLAVCDGVGIVIAGKIFGKKFRGRVHGVDLVTGIAENVADKPITVGFLGGRENVAQLTSDCLKKKYPSLKVSFVSENPPEDLSEINADIIFVAFGSPKQEKWIYEHMNDIDSKVFVGVGGAFDFISGKVMRAPVFIRRIGLEWMFRLLIQPWRIKRQFALVRFMLVVVKEKLF